jgi:hypothetical protein
MGQSIDPVEFEFEAEEKPRAIVAIPSRLPLLLRYVTPALAVIFIGLGLGVDPVTVGEGRADGAAGWTFVLSLVAVILILTVPATIMAAWGPRFAVLKDGIKMPFNRLSPRRSSRDPWSYGFYSWSEVSYCRWSPYNPGVLSVHLQAAEHHVPVLGAESDGHMKMPPMIYFYRVPERHRAAVESAIRACGKWVE